jgi:voltage-gated sodium channel
MKGFAARCSRIAESSRFQGFIYAVIIGNAVVLGLSTYPRLESDHGHLLTVINEVCLGIFVVEIAIRIAAYGRRPHDFFRNGWNVFDFVVVSLGLIPGLRKSATLVRLARLMRVARVASVRSDLRAVALGMARSLPAIGSLIVMVTLVVYFYAMIGWLLFSEDDPTHWGTIGRAMLTLFTVSTLEGWDVILYEAQEIRAEAWIFFVSFVLLISFLVINIVLGIFMNSIEQERQSAQEQHGRDKRELDRRLEELRQALVALEAERVREEKLEDAADERERARVDARLDVLRRALLELETEVARSKPPDQMDRIPRLSRRAGRF